MATMVEHVSANEARSKYLENLDAACEHGRWLAVAFAVSSDGTLQLHRTTYRFPIDRMDEALNMLRENLERERGGSRPTPLPLAAHLQKQNGGPRLTDDERDLVHRAIKKTMMGEEESDKT